MATECREPSDGYGPECNLFGEGHICGGDMKKPCYDFPEVVLHAPGTLCGRYRPGGKCKPEKPPFPPSNDHEASAWYGYAQWLLRVSGFESDIENIQSVAAEGVTETADGEVIGGGTIRPDMVPDMGGVLRARRKRTFAATARSFPEAEAIEKAMRGMGVTPLGAFSWDELEKKIRESEYFVLFVPGDAPDFKVTMELGLAMLLGKPIIAVKMPDRELSPTLVKIAELVIEIDKTDAASAMLVAHAINEHIEGKGNVRLS
jgi:hypothetical protein